MIDLYAYIDVESSGLLRPELPPDDPSQPRIISLSTLLTTADRRVVGSMYRIVKPDGWSIEVEAQQVHGISERLAHEVGVPIWFVLAELEQFVTKATRIIGHNIQGFDRLMIARELQLAGQHGVWWHSRARDFVDTMELSAPLLGLTGRVVGEPKFPTLQEAVRFLGRGFDVFDDDPNFAEVEGGKLTSWQQSHRADEDARAVEFCHWRLRTMEESLVR